MTAIESARQLGNDFDGKAHFSSAAPAGRIPPLGLHPGSDRPRLYDEVVSALRVRHYSRRTEEAYLHWIRRYTEFHERRHPRQLAEGEVNRFLTHLAVKEHIAASTQNQAYRKKVSDTFLRK